MAFMVLLGIWATVGHYIGPKPTAAMLETGFFPPGPEWFLQQLPLYQEHVLMTALHVVPSLIFVLLIALQLSGRIRRRNLDIHRWMGRVLVVSGILFAISGVYFGLVMPFGGTIETLVILVVVLLFLASLAMGVIRIRQRNISAHRFWMLHMVVLAFSPVTMRLLLGPMMLMMDMSGQQVFGLAILLATVLNLVLLHLYLRRTSSVSIAQQTLV